MPLRTGAVPDAASAWKSQACEFGCSESSEKSIIKPHHDVDNNCLLPLSFMLITCSIFRIILYQALICLLSRIAVPNIPQVSAL